MTPEDRAFLNAVHQQATALGDAAQLQATGLKNLTTMTSINTMVIAALMAEVAGTDRERFDKLLAKTTDMMEGLKLVDTQAAIVLGMADQLRAGAETYFNGPK
jgi:hypothetical protein